MFSPQKSFLTIYRTSMTNIVGSFYLKKTSSGNLIGEFTNCLNPKIFTESADLVNKSEEMSFLGDYTSTWIEEEIAILVSLKIEWKEDSNKKKFRLTWSNAKTTFHGEGFLLDDLLIGHYLDETAKTIFED